ncbi:LysE family translocator [Aureimonas jatrophae]|uniref:Threonine/homoserine/homoserine lactone efflux protein n=1 Tax=Aureimonas jatrophae TaxID=1166073 RepID=A0A1H0DNT7_9HYPH|nr:LysE family translocator [Aureimonas jatrophae]MBB3952002.1 threonine/homoserine/homoserine lactone efflux protein [Aureimonas jatrophae]SDN71907.1 Threonine/homoserine/homoserine lactone efflux protein [Aureimonas jatrophae]
MGWDFLITSLVIVASPGTGVVVTLAAALSRGFRASAVAALGCTLGIVPHMLAAITGLAAVLHASALAFEVIRYAGVAYLLFMAWMTLRENGPLRVEPDAAPRSDGQVVLSAILVNLLNPKLSIFFFAFLPQFVAPETAGALARMTELSLVFMAMTLAVFLLYGAFAAAVRDRIVSRPAVMAWMRRSFAAAFALLGLRLALAER